MKDTKWYVLLELSGGAEAGSLRGVAESLLAAAVEEGIVTDVVNASHLMTLRYTHTVCHYATAATQFP